MLTKYINIDSRNRNKQLSNVYSIESIISTNALYIIENKLYITIKNERSLIDNAKVGQKIAIQNVNTSKIKVFHQLDKPIIE